MNRYRQAFDSLRARGEAAFIPFAVAGDPSLRASEDILKAYVDSGADMLEIGYPFSDPIADGPVNQRAAGRAIAAGLTPKSFFGLMDRIRAYTGVPMGLLLYANTAHHCGYEAFCRRASDSGLDSLLVADMPPEESGLLLESVDKHGLRSVFIVSELTPPARIREICRRVSGFVYVVSRLGPTGVQTTVEGAVATTLARLRRHTDLPLCVGFGLSKPEHIRTVIKAGADGAIVGSALVASIEATLDRRTQMLCRLRTMVRQYKRATRA